MDFSETFDTINHELLLRKLHMYDFNRYPLKIIHNYLNNRNQRTKTNKVLSSWTKILWGVSQVSVLGPILFNIYLNDLIYLAEKNICNFADDTIFHAYDSSLDYLVKIKHDVNLAVQCFDGNYTKLNQDNVIL